MYSMHASNLESAKAVSRAVAGVPFWLAWLDKRQGDDQGQRPALRQDDFATRATIVLDLNGWL